MYWCATTPDYDADRQFGNCELYDPLLVEEDGIYFKHWPDQRAPSPIVTSVGETVVFEPTNPLTNISFFDASGSEILSSVYTSTGTESDNSPAFLQLSADLEQPVQVIVNGNEIATVEYSDSMETTEAPEGAVYTLPNTGGPPGQPARLCQFPFTFQGVEYTSCACTDGIGPWCPVQSSNLLMHESWGLCDPQYLSPEERECPAASAALSGIGSDTTPFSNLEGTQESGSGSSSAGSSQAVPVALGVLVAALVLALVAVYIHNARFKK